MLKQNDKNIITKRQNSTAKQENWILTLINPYGLVTNSEMEQTSVESLDTPALIEESHSRTKSIASSRLRPCLTYISIAPLRRSSCHDKNLLSAIFEHLQEAFERKRRKHNTKFTWCTLNMMVVAALGWVENFITSAERELKDSRRSGMSQSCFFWDKIGHAKSVGIWFYSAIWRNESRISSRYLEVTSISLIYSSAYSACPGFEPTYRCGPSDQRRL